MLKNLEGKDEAIGVWEKGIVFKCPQSNAVKKSFVNRYKGFLLRHCFL